MGKHCFSKGTPLELTLMIFIVVFFSLIITYFIFYVNIFFTKKHKTPLLLVTHGTYVVALNGTKLIYATYQADENKVFSRKIFTIEKSHKLACLPACETLLVF